MNEESSARQTGRNRDVVGLIVFLGLTFGAASFGALFAPGEWYASLAKPAWTPPSWIFGPVWSALYVLIAVSGWLVWRAQRSRGPALGLWLAQLGFNALWSWLFFGLERPDLAAIDIVVLLLAICATAYAFSRISRAAALLLLPYAFWVSYATALNIAIWRLNA